MREKILKLMKELNKGLVERDDAIKAALLALLAQENLILIGPPGTAKSEISRRMAQAVKDDGYFEYLLTKFTTPEEIFGPLSIKELKEDRFKRNTEGYMPTAKIVFLDEIFKANSSILNSLLTIINEKTFHNGKEKQTVPLLSLVGASNELPVNDENLKALYDRFLIRKVVDYVSDDSIEQLFDITNGEFNIEEKYKMTIKEIDEIKEKSKKVEIPEEIKYIIQEIRKKFKEEFKENSIEEISDRRLVKIIKLLKVSAYTNGRKEVDLSDVLILRNCLWNDSGNIDKIREIIIHFLNIELTKIGYKMDEVNNRKMKIMEIKYEAGKLKGEGTKDNPFLIETASDLYLINTSEILKKEYYFEQIENIDLAEIEYWHSIGNLKENNKIEFKGYYNGGGKKILNLKGEPLFDTVAKEGTLKNINMESVNIIGRWGNDLEQIGVMARINNGKILDIEIRENINVVISNANSQIGSIVGCNNGEILNIKLSGNINIKNNECFIINSYIGGIAAVNNGKILNVELRSNININIDKTIDSSSFFIGGIVVGNYGEISNIKLSGNIISNIIIAEKKVMIGGISYQNNGKITNSIITPKYIVLLNGNELKKIDSSNENSVKKRLDEEFYRKELKWDFDNVWKWDNEVNEPILQDGGENNSKLNIFEANIWL